MSSFSPLDPHLVVGNLITMDPALPRAEAMAIVGGRIVATGTITQMRAFLPTGKILRPDAAAITPGFVDSHLHMLIAGLEMQRLDLDGVGSVAEILKCIAAHAGQSSGAGWLIAAANFHTDELLERRLPTRAELDEVCPDRPLVLDQRTHDAIVNTRALRLAGIDRNTPDPVGGHIERDSRGDPTGLLVERPAAQLVTGKVPAPSTDDMKAALLRVQPELHRLGITTIAEPGLTAAEIGAYTELHAARELTMRSLIMPLIDGRSPVSAELKRIAGLGVRTGFGDERLRLGGLKVYFDGAGSFGTALLREPWPGSPHYYGTQVMSTEDLSAVATFCARERWSLAVHAVGGGALDVVLNVFAQVNRERDIRDLRFSLLHAYLWPTEENMACAAELGVLVAAQPGLVWRVGAGIVGRFGETTARDIGPLASWLRAGVHVAGGSDGPDFPMDPLFNIWQARTRCVKGINQPLGPAQALTADRALALFTTHSAYACFCEYDCGSLAPGKLADWVALSHDPLLASDAELRNARVLQTAVGGRKVFDISATP